MVFLRIDNKVNIKYTWNTNFEVKDNVIRWKN